MTSPELHGKVLIILFIQQDMDGVSTVGQAAEMDPESGIPRRCSLTQAHMQGPLYPTQCSFMHTMMDSLLSFPDSEKNGVPTYISHSAFLVCYGLNETISAGLGTRTTMYTIVSMGKCIQTFTHPAIFTNFQTGEYLGWRIQAEIVQRPSRHSGCPTSQILTLPGVNNILFSPNDSIK